MKKILSIFLCVCFCFLMVGCDNQTKVRTAHISDATAALSKVYAIKVVLDTDERMEEKFVDLQIRSSEENQLLTFGEENEEVFEISLPKKDYWYNLTYLIDRSNGVAVVGVYQTYEDFWNKMYIFTSENDVELTFRVVAGQIKTNEQTKEQILVLSEDISDETVIKVKKFEET